MAGPAAPRAEGSPSDAPPTAAAQVYPLVDARALDRPFDYAVPAALEKRVRAGALVACPLGPRRVLGVVVSRDPPTHAGRLAPLAGVVDEPPVAPELLELARWVARYYLAPVAACLRLVLPPGAEGSLRRGAGGEWRLAPLRQGPAPRLVAELVGAAPAEGARGRRREVARLLAAAGGRRAAADLCRDAGTTMPTLRRMEADGLVRLVSERPDPSGLAPALGVPTAPPDLTEEQGAALAAVVGHLDGGGGELLLHGVTGSGKTEVYLRAIEEARARGRSSLVLVPEIALTPQLLGRLRGRLGERVAVWHSGLSPGERSREHRRARDGDADVVLGARSAVFAPLPRLGLVIVDEEHDSSYKQDATPRYDARQVAVRRGRGVGAAVVLGTATPRPETWRALERRTLSRRADGSDLPAVEVVDMRTQGPGPVSRPLTEALRAAAERGEKAVLLLNRRGFALMALCRACGWVARCPDCDVAMVQHPSPPRLSCHHCGRERPVPGVCPQCAAADVARQGSGTQGLEAALRRIVPEARLVRMDATTTAGRGAVARLLADFARPGAAILLGTQIVAKGHDLPHITVAGALDADAALQHAGFRAEERAFGLIVQLAGRAGRRGERSRVVVQAFEPGARAVRLGARHAVEEFLEGELARRRELGFPPFGHLARLVLDAGAESEAAALAGAMAASVRRAPGVRLLGPAPLHRLRGRHRWALLARAERAPVAAAPLRAAAEEHADALRRAGARVAIDVDPQET